MIARNSILQHLTPLKPKKFTKLARSGCYVRNKKKTRSTADDKKIIGYHLLSTPTQLASKLEPNLIFEIIKGIPPKDATCVMCASRKMLEQVSSN